MAQYRIGALMVGALGSMCALISPAAEAPAPAPEPAPALAPEPAFSFDGTPGRLPKDVVPERYEVAITPNMKTMIIAGRESVTLRRYALANATQILADYNDYFGYPFPLPKLDSISIPGGFSGAMENWGAITYQEEVLLLPPSSTLSQQQQIYATQAHEMAHQWNGDLVTMAWWDDLWLNESFASWMETKETALRNPEWRWWEQEDADKETAMSADALPNSPPIQQHVADELQAANAFDPSITYNKGRSFLRMLEAYLGPEEFRDGIRRYIKARAFSNATTTDLWNALAAATGKDIAGIAGDWTRRPGFPLLRVDATCGADGARTLHLAQTRFLSRGSAPGESHWSIPLQVRIGSHGQPRAELWSADAIPAGSCADTLSLNADAIGYYRVLYDEATLKTNTTHFGELPAGDRIAMLDDQWALVLAGAQALDSYLALASHMGQDLDTRAWQQISAALGHIEYDERGRPGHEVFTAYARSVLAPAFAALGWDAKPGQPSAQQELRRTLISDLGAWGDEEVLRGARLRFAQFLKDPASLPANEQAPILAVVAHNADAKTFEQLHQLARGAKNLSEIERFYNALVQVRDPQLAEQAAQIIMSSEIPPQALQARLDMVITLAHEHPALGWRLFTVHSHELLASYGDMEPLMEAQYVPPLFWDSAPLEEVEGWVRSKIPAEMAPALEHGMDAARLLVAEKGILVREADQRPGR